MIASGKPVIELRRVFRQFGSTTAVNDVSFHVDEGEVFGYIGPNGAGKTTSMKILATLDLPTYGDAFVNGFSVVNDPDKVRKDLGFMPDSFGTYSHVNCEEYLDFFARAYGLMGAERRRTLRRVMSFTQLDSMAFKPINGLSKGMKQRLCLGRALINDPKVLILDEPAAGLDPRARIELRDMIGELASQKKSILISSHILTELAEMCDRVGIIEQGRLLATGTVDEILHHDNSNASEQRTQSTIRVGCVGESQPMVDWLQQQPNVSNVTLNLQSVEFHVGNDKAEHAKLLRALIDNGFEIFEFAEKQKTLEQAFLEVTQGRVQ